MPESQHHHQHYFDQKPGKAAPPLARARLALRAHHRAPPEEIGSLTSISHALSRSGAVMQQKGNGNEFGSGKAQGKAAVAEAWARLRALDTPALADLFSLPIRIGSG